MSTIASTTARPSNEQGRLILEIEFEGGRRHVFDVNAEPFWRLLADVLRDGSTRRLNTSEDTKAPASSFNPIEESGGSGGHRPPLQVEQEISSPS